MSLAERMRAAADILEEAGRLYGYPYPEWAKWSAETLRGEAQHVEEES